MKIIIVGANHAATAAVNTILDNYEDVELTVYDKNSNISLLGCGMALWIGEQISTSDGLFYSSKEAMEEKGAKVFMETEVTYLDPYKKTIKGLYKDGTEFTDTYDKIILGTGSRPRIPDIEGKDLENIQFAKLFQDAQDVKAMCSIDDIQDVIVTGSGYIGVELAEAFKRIGKNVSLVSRSKNILRGYFDPEFSNELKTRMEDHGIKFYMEEDVVKYEGENNKVKAVVTDKGSRIACDMVVNSIGFLPNSQLGEDAFDRFDNGAYLVNKKFQTNVEDVYAIGDCSTEFNNATGETGYIALATNAVRSGIVAAHNACSTDIESAGVQGSSALKIYDYNLVATGLSLEIAQKEGIEVLHSDFEDVQKAGFMEVENPNVKIRIVYRKDNRKIVGCQLGSNYDVSMGIHLFSLAIQEGVTVDKLALTDIFFMPHFNQPYNYITMAALAAE